MRKFYSLFLFSLIIISCEKDKQIIIENTGMPLLSQVLIGGEVYEIYSYNEANLVTEEKSKFQYTRHIYNGSNQLVKSDFYWDESAASSSSIVYSAGLNRKEWANPGNTPRSLFNILKYDIYGQLIRKSYYREANKNPEYIEYIYESGRISRQVMYWQNAISGYIDYSYDDNGNVIKMAKYSINSGSAVTLLTTTEYEYDSMKNPYQSFRRFMTPGKYTNQNNITRETYTIHFDVDQWTEKVQVQNNTYEYNSSGYPVKVNGVWEYIYK
jgi:hypothetical protein